MLPLDDYLVRKLTFRNKVANFLRSMRICILFSLIFPEIASIKVIA